jgi:hypothetical protein
MFVLREHETRAGEARGYEVDGPVEGGLDGVDNIPLKELTNRTACLKKELGEAGQRLSGLAGFVHNGGGGKERARGNEQRLV